MFWIEGHTMSIPQVCLYQTAQTGRFGAPSTVVVDLDLSKATCLRNAKWDRERRFQRLPLACYLNLMGVIILLTMLVGAGVDRINVSPFGCEITFVRNASATFMVLLTRFVLMLSGIRSQVVMLAST
jgi:hypothetical protein